MVMAAFLLPGGPVLAEPVEVSLAAPPELAAEAVAWEAFPLALGEGVGEVAPVSSGGPVTGPWIVALEPGDWQVTGLAGEVFLNAQVTIAAEGESFVVAAEPPPAGPPYLCQGDAPCSYVDAATGLAFALPPGWAAAQPTGSADGAVDGKPWALFFEPVEGVGGAAWELNPSSWTEFAGPCREVALGQLCTPDVDTEVDPAAEAAFAVIAPSLALSAAAP